MNETPKHIGRFDVFGYDINPNFDVNELGYWVDYDFDKLPGFSKLATCHNLLMAPQKLAMANAVYPSIATLVITNQTTSPVDTETAPGGATIYTTLPADEYLRSADGNPYQVGWNIISDSANGTWGSFCLLNGSGQLINRALAGITKNAGQGRLVLFTGSVV